MHRALREKGPGYVRLAGKCAECVADNCRTRRGRQRSDWIPRAETDFALKWQLEDLRKRIIGETTSKAKHDSCTSSGATPNQSPTDPPCGRDISKPSVRLLPIQAMTGQNNQQLPDSAYYAGLKKLYEAAANDTRA